MGRHAPSDLLHLGTGEQTTYAELGKEFSLNPVTVKNRYQRGKRGWDLVVSSEMSPARRSVISKQVILRRNEEMPSLDECLDQFMRQPAGRLTTHLFRDYAADRR